MIINKRLCDNCGKEDIECCMPVSLSCGFGSIFDEERFDFCSDKCCAEFILAKLKEVEEKGTYTLPIRDEYTKSIETDLKMLEDKMKEKRKDGQK